MKISFDYRSTNLCEQHYYSFGMLQPNRGYQGTGYRYGFNGKENDNEVKGITGSQQDYGMRIYDPRLGKFLSVDPISSQYPWLTPYQFASNRPIDGVDLDGKEYVIASIATDAFFAQLGITFCDEVEKQTYLKSKTVMYKGEAYVNMGNHIYQNADGNYSFENGEDKSKVSTWVYNVLEKPALKKENWVMYDEYAKTNGASGCCAVAQESVEKETGYNIS